MSNARKITLESVHDDLMYLMIKTEELYYAAVESSKEKKAEALNEESRVLCEAAYAIGKLLNKGQQSC